ncbi:hypothetical protein BAT_2941 [Bacillus pumilus ATCC 7061]|nr:hypothetical protein BAT_2941 [Bacillus pumilus ATCC 7061]
MAIREGHSELDSSWSAADVSRTVFHFMMMNCTWHPLGE